MKTGFIKIVSEQAAGSFTCCSNTSVRCQGSQCMAWMREKELVSSEKPCPDFPKNRMISENLGEIPQVSKPSDVASMVMVETHRGYCGLIQHRG